MSCTSHTENFHNPTTCISSQKPDIPVQVYVVFEKQFGNIDSVFSNSIDACHAADERNKISHPLFDVRYYFTVLPFTLKTTFSVPSIILPSSQQAQSSLDIKKNEGSKKMKVQTKIISSLDTFESDSCEIDEKEISKLKDLYSDSDNLRSLSFSKGNHTYFFPHSVISKAVIVLDISEVNDKDELERNEKGTR